MVSVGWVEARPGVALHPLTTPCPGLASASRLPARIVEAPAQTGGIRNPLSKPKKRQYEQNDDDQADEINDAV
jgi:hypothetical protein